MYFVAYKKQVIKIVIIYKKNNKFAPIFLYTSDYLDCDISVRQKNQNIASFDNISDDEMI